MRFRTLSLAFATATALAAACSSDPQSAENAGQGGGTSGAAGSAGSQSAGAGGDSDGAAGSSGSGGSAGSGGTGTGGSTGSGGSTSSGGSGGTVSIPDAAVPDVKFTYDAPVIVEDACAAETVAAEPIPLDMYVMIDTSGSMGNGNNCSVSDPSPGTKLCRAVKALYGYFSSPDAVGNGVALQQFNSTGCSALSNPAVQMDALPNHLATIQTWLQGLVDNGSTNTEGALLGLRDYTNPATAPSPPAGFGQPAGRLIIGILITDGDPSGCVTNINNLATIIDNHFTATGISTYVVGMTGATYGNIENLANGAGAPPHNNYCGTAAPCHHYDVSAGDPTAFIDAMNAIQKSAVGCTFAYPNPPSGVPDPSSLSVTYSAGGVGPPQDIPAVANAGACGPGGGYYLDSPINPTTIDLCPATCDAVTADPAAKIDVEIACEGS